MKKIIGLLSIMMLFIAFNVQAQTSETVDLNSLSPEERAKVEAIVNAHQQNNGGAVQVIHEIKEFDWEGMGETISKIFNEALNGVDAFFRTRVGNFTMIMIAWNMIGKDVVRILLGLIFIGIFTWLLIYSFKRTCIERRILVKKTNPGFLKFPKVKEYEIVEPAISAGEGLGVIRIAHLVFFFIGIWITYGIMFAG